MFKPNKPLPRTAAIASMSCMPHSLLLPPEMRKLEEEVCLFLKHPTRVLSILTKHWPRAFGGALAIGLDGVDFVVVP